MKFISEHMEAVLMVFNNVTGAISDGTLASCGNDCAKISAELLNVSPRTVERYSTKRKDVSRRGNPKNVKTPRQNHSVPESVSEICRVLCVEATSEGRSETWQSLTEKVNNKLNSDYTYWKIRRFLLEKNFTYDMGEVRHEDTEFILKMVETCIQRLRRNKHTRKEKQMQEVYLDDSYCHTHHSRSQILHHPDDTPNVNKPSGVGLRLIMIGAGTR